MALRFGPFGRPPLAGEPRRVAEQRKGQIRGGSPNKVGRPTKGGDTHNKTITPSKYQRGKRSGSPKAQKNDGC